MTYNLLQHPLIIAYLAGASLIVNPVDENTVSFTQRKFNPDTGQPMDITANFLLTDIQELKQEASAKAAKFESLATEAESKSSSLIVIP